MKSILAVIVNYGSEQLEYLAKMVKELKSFEKYNVTIIVHSNIPIQISGIDELRIFELQNYQLLPLTCRTTIWDNRDNYDLFFFSENDHLLQEHHVDKHLEYTSILPEDKISGLLQYEEKEGKKYYPAYHANYRWDKESVEQHGNKIFASFTNLHQACFLVTQEQLKRIGLNFNFTKLVNYSFWRIIKNKIADRLGLSKPRYSVKCKVNTDLYEFGGMKKVICISEFDKNLIHHMPNLYINGEKGRHKLREGDEKMKNDVLMLLKSVK